VDAVEVGAPGTGIQLYFKFTAVPQTGQDSTSMALSHAALGRKRCHTGVGLPEVAGMVCNREQHQQFAATVMG
jgi:hypothetical protein